jgi:lipopolysaccharide/colanic/teichoic acid biosynthesis glycosyltransferase
LAKRIFDLLLAICALVVLGVPSLAIACMVRLKLGSPVFFHQVRPGLRGAPFKIVKFRSMTDVKDRAGKLKPDAQRLTPFGIFLRSTSLDELPELLNVVMGDMSFVGPRPLLVEYLPLYTTGQAKRHNVRPGITGWAQINGRNALSWDERFELDVWYVDNQSFWLDIRILFLTMRQVLLRRDISADGEATMTNFKGSK